MKKVLILYSSHYGSTKKYAEWIAEELNGDGYDLNSMNQNNVIEYDVIILGIALYPEKVNGIEIFENNYKIIKDKKLVVFACGLSDFDKAENRNIVTKRFQKIIPENLFENIKIFFLRGNIDYKKMNLKHRIMMGFKKKQIKRKGFGKMDEEDKLLLETYGKKIDFTEKKNIKEIIEYCKK